MRHEAPESLSSFQTHFTQTITHQNDSQVIPNIVGGGTLSSEASLEVYRNDYRFRLCGALGDRYESVWLLLGDEQFQELAFAYIQANPSSFRDLTNYGKDFPEFLSSNYAEQLNELILEMARFERSFWELFHLPIPQVQDCNAMMKGFGSPEQLWNHHWRLTPHLRFIRSDWNLWRFFSKRKQTSAEIAEEDWQGPLLGILFKESIQLQFQHLTESQYALLESLQCGLSIAEFIDSGKQIAQAEMQELFAILGQTKLILL